MEIEEIVNTLKKNKLFKGLSEETIKDIAPYISVREFKKGRIIFFEGDTGRFLFLIKRGKLEILKKNNKGEEVQIALFGPGDFIGEMALIEESVRSATCRAVEDSEVLLFSHRAFFDLIESKPKAACKLLLEIAKVLSKRLRDL
ncbi:MAG: cyclic nucleotide-binding domain-containing protein [Candidatus Hydrothermales bacterium]